MKRATKIALAVLVLSLFLSACGSGSSEDIPHQSGNLTTVNEVLAAAREAAASVVSYRMVWRPLGNQADETNPDKNMATLTWAAPDQFHFRSETAEEGGVDLFEIMGADGQVWFRHSDADDSWTDAKADGFEVRGSLAQAEHYSKRRDIVPDMDEMSLVGKTVIDGLSVYHVKGTITSKMEPPDDSPADEAADDSKMEPPDDLPADGASGFRRQQIDTAYDLYINIDNLLPRRLISIIDFTWEGSSGGTPENEPTHMEVTLDYLDFNAPVTIVLPEVR